MAIITFIPNLEEAFFPKNFSTFSGVRHYKMYQFVGLSKNNILYIHNVLEYIL